MVICTTGLRSSLNISVYLGLNICGLWFIIIIIIITIIIIIIIIIIISIIIITILVREQI